jgi:hypothetical protein
MEARSGERNSLERHDVSGSEGMDDAGPAGHHERSSTIQPPKGHQPGCTWKTGQPISVRQADGWGVSRGPTR